MAPRFEGCEQVEQIGRGGFGTVYRAYQTTFRRKVAIKVISVGTSDDTTIRRFRREVGAVGSLSGHPHIVVVHDIGTTEQGDPYLVMAHLSGGTLGDRVDADDGLSWRAAISWTIKLAGALEAAHAAGVLHLDVKPDNVLFDEFGEPQLVDFGIARLEGVTHSRSGHVKATPLYAAPEVLSGVRPSPAADVYSLAATAYAALRGRPAFLEPTDETLAPMLTRVLTQPPDALPEAVLPGPMWAVMARALAKDPDARPAGAGEFGRELQEAQRQVGVPVTTMTVPGVRSDEDTDTRAMDPVARVATPASEDLNQTRAGAVTPPPLGDVDARPTPPPRRRRRLLLIAALLVVAVGAGLGAFVLADDDEPGAEDVLADIDPATLTPGDLARPDADNPAARPTELGAEATGDDEVQLRWTNNAPAAQGVAVQVGRRVMQVLLPDQVVTRIAGTDPDTRTCFLVGSVSQGRVSWVEQAACVVNGPPDAVGAPSARREDGEYVRLQWRDRAGNEQGFRIEQAGEVIERLLPGQEQFVVDDVDESARACFTVVAFNEAGTSPSDEVCVDPR